MYEEARKLLKTISENCVMSIFHTGITIASVEENSHVTVIHMEDDTVYPVELIIVSISVRTNNKAYGRS